MWIYLFIVKNSKIWGLYNTRFSFVTSHSRCISNTIYILCIEHMCNNTLNYTRFTQECIRYTTYICVVYEWGCACKGMWQQQLSYLIIKLLYASFSYLGYVRRESHKVLTIYASSWLGIYCGLLSIYNLILKIPNIYIHTYIGI